VETGTELYVICSRFRFEVQNRPVAAPAEPVKEEKPLSSWKLAELVIPDERIVLLYGPPGTGKTYAANKAGTPSVISNITVTEETPAAELRGHFIPRGGEFHWMDGPALARYRNGGRLVLNEIDKASGDAMVFCHALLDDADISAITLPTGETVTPHPDFQCVATMNGIPEDLPDALSDRFTVHIAIDKPHPSAVKLLPKDLQKAARTTVFAGDRAVSLRGWKKFADLREKHGETNAAFILFGDSYQTILNTLKISGSGFNAYKPEEEE
jgi:MoxR-like ATPase